MNMRRLPPYPPPRPPKGRSLAAQASVRLVQRRHCLYRVCQKNDRASVWCRPVSPEGMAWMRAQGVDAQRVVCDHLSVDGFIDRREGVIAATVVRLESNILTAPRRKSDA